MTKSNSSEEVNFTYMCFNRAKEEKIAEREGLSTDSLSYMLRVIILYDNV